MLGSDPTKTPQLGVPEIEYLRYARETYDDRAGEAVDLASSGTPWLDPAALAVLPIELMSVSKPAEFRRAIARRYGVDPNEVGLARGTSSALYTTLRAIAGPGERIVVETPAYEPLWRVPEGLGFEVSTFSRLWEEGYRLDPRRVLDALGPDGRIVLVADPHNPTGVATDRAVLLEIADALAKRGGYLLVDECYRDIELDGADLLAAEHAGDALSARPHPTARQHPAIIAMNSLTKVHGLPWARSGWLLGPPDLCERAENVGYHVMGHYGYDYAAWGLAAFARLGTLKSRAERLQGSKRKTVERWLDDHESLTWTPSADGLWFGFIRSKNGLNITDFCLRAFTEARVMLAPGAFFGDPTAFRLAWTAPEQEVAAALTRLDALLADLL